MSESLSATSSSGSAKDEGAIRKNAARKPGNVLERWLFDSPALLFVAVLFGVSLLKTGVWYMPNTGTMRQLALDPFSNPFAGSGSDYLIWNWLAPFVAWVIGATGKGTFILFHMAFSLAFTGLFWWMSFARLSGRDARVAIALFTILPVSATTYYWVGMDSVTLFLMLAVFVFPNRALWAFGVGVLLGMQHSEQGVVASGALLSASVLALILRVPSPVSLRFSGLLLVGVLAGKACLMAIFHYAGIVVDADRLYWVEQLLPITIRDFFLTFQYQLWAVLAVGWLVFFKYLGAGRRAVPFALPMLGLLGLLLLVFDQTRVVSIVSFPLIFAFWLGNRGFIASLSNRFVSLVVLAWLLVPWIWVFGGKPQASVLPYDVAAVFSKLTHRYQLPEDLAFWPFWYEPPITTNAISAAPKGFEHSIIDPSPIAGDGCCLDVLALGDLDGDGKPDIMLASQNAAGWFWYQNPSWERHDIAPGEFTTDGRIADINADGRMDTVLSAIGNDGQSGSIAWWENLGRPSEPDGWRRHEIADFFVHDMLVADFDGDGHPDVALFAKDGSRRGVFWAKSPSDPTQTWEVHAIAEGLDGEGLAVGDVDGDGSMDIVANHRLFRNDGHGQFTLQELPSICESGASGDIRPAIAGIDGDGHADIVLGPAEACIGPVAWFSGPDFGTRHDIGSGSLTGNHTLEIADFNGDGRPDILAGEMHTGNRRVIVYTNAATAPWPATVLSDAGTHNARIADLDGNGLPDIVGKNYDGPKPLEAWFDMGTPDAKP